MILPNKYVPVDQSLIGLAAAFLSRISRPRTITGLWEDVRAYPAVDTFDRFALTLDFLFALGVIELRDGMLRRTSS